jgi:hypothetical protein
MTNKSPTRVQFGFTLTDHWLEDSHPLHGLELDFTISASVDTPNSLAAPR